MTAIKQVAVTRPQHLRSLEKYLDCSNGRHDIAGRGSQNLVDERNWAREMDRTREAYGHNAPSRQGKACTYMYHQILGFNPDDCSMNGGRMDEGACLRYAAEYVMRRYPDQEAVWVLHKEHSRDGTDRWAVHIGINRTNLTTGRRLDEGPARKARAARVATVREMDEEWGLRQLVRGKRNSRSHVRQPSRTEARAQAAMVAESRRHGKEPMPTDRERVRRAVARSVDEVANGPKVEDPEEAFRKSLARRGIELGRSPRGDYQYRWRDGGTVHKANGISLGEIRTKQGRTFRFSRGAILSSIRVARLIERGMERPRDDGRGR